MYVLKEQVVLITGAANGIGAEFVKLLAEHGVKHVRVLDVDENAGILLQNDVNLRYGENKVKFTKCDVSIKEDLYKAFEDVKEEYGYIDVVVNNAGVANESTSENIQKEVDINLTALINGTHKAIKLMRNDEGGKGGTVINVSSVAALVKRCPVFVYAATKSAVLQFSISIGKSSCLSRTGVRVITVCYGQTSTEIFNKMASFVNDVQLQEYLRLLRAKSVQTAEMAARGTIEAFMKGESGSAWLIRNGKPAMDITSNIDKVHSDMAKIIDG